MIAKKAFLGTGFSVFLDLPLWDKIGLFLLENPNFRFSIKGSYFEPKLTQFW